MPQWDRTRRFTAQRQHCRLNCLQQIPCPIMTVDRNLTTPYVWNWTLNVQHAFTANLSIEAAYVGNHGSNLSGFATSTSRRWDPDGNGPPA